MANINKDFLVVADLKTAKVQAPSMIGYNTDKRIFNIFLKLQITMSSNPDIKVYVTNEEASNYKVKFTVVKPRTNQLRYIEGVHMNIGTSGHGAVYQFDLPAEFTDQVGVYKCELTVTCDVNGYEELITCDMFTYTIKPSVVTGLNPEIESKPELPVLEQLIEEVRELQGQGGGTNHTHNNKTTLDKITNDKIDTWDNKQDKTDNRLNTTSKDIVGAINEINAKPSGGGEVDLSGYQTKIDNTLNTTSKNIVGAINELNSKPVGFSKIDLTVNNNIVTMTKDDIQNVTLSNDTTVNLPTNLNSKEIFFNVICNTKDIIITFVQGSESNKVKLSNGSYNVFQLSVNGSDIIIERKSTEYPELTQDEINQGVTTGGLDLSIYQEKNDNTLNTTSKNIVGSINELNTSKANKNEVLSSGNIDSLGTTNKTVVGGINELNQQYQQIANEVNFLKPNLVTTNIVEGTLTLTIDKYQTTTMGDATEIVLPTVTEFTEIHLFFSTSVNLTLILPNCKWQTTPTFVANKNYELIFTYTDEWLGGVVVYG